MFRLIPAQFAQGKRQHGKHGHQTSLQHKNAPVQAQQLPVFQHRADIAHLRLRVLMHAQTRRFRRVSRHQRDTGHAQHAHQHEQAFHANPIGQHGRKHQADGKRQADAQTNH